MNYVGITSRIFYGKGIDMVNEVEKVFLRWIQNINNIAEKSNVPVQEIKEHWYKLTLLERKKKDEFTEEIRDLYVTIETDILAISEKYEKSYNEIWELLEKLELQFESFEAEYTNYLHIQERRSIEDEKISRLNYECIGKTIRDFGHKGMVIEGKKFSQCRFSLLRFKDCKVKNCAITQCIVDEDSYLRHAEFENVDFTGTIFRNCNLEKAKFINCNLNYVKFDNCLLDIPNIIKSSMPKEENLKLALCKSLYNNELQQGRTDMADTLLVMVMKEEAKLNKCILFAKTDYYKKLREGNVVKCIYKYISLVLQRLLFGYGFSIGRSIVSMLMIIFIFVGIYSLLLFENYSKIGDTVICAIILSFKSFILGTADITIAKVKESVWLDSYILAENAFGLLYFAFFTSTFYRRITRR